MIPTTSNRKFFYGWISLIGGAIIWFASGGTTWFSWGAFLPLMSKDLGWSRSVLTLPGSTYNLVLGLTGMVVGISLRRFGIRKNMIFGCTMCVLGLGGMYLATQVWHVYLFYSVLAGIGFSFSASITTFTLVNNWFVRRRSLAMGILLSAGGLAGFTIVPLITWLSLRSGWRVAWLYLAGIELVMSVAGIALVKDKPEDVGQLPDGDITPVAQETAAKDPVPSCVYQTPIEWKIGDALRSPVLWLIILFNCATMFSRMILQMHHVAYVQDIGFAPLIASSTLGLQIGTSTPARLGVGALGLRIETRHVAVVCLASFLAAMVILIYANTLPLIYLYTILAGLGWGGMMVVRPTMLGAYYGRTCYPLIEGLTGPIGTLVTFGSPLIAAFIYDSTGSYRTAFIIAAVLLVIGLACAFLARPPKPRTEVEKA